MSRILPGATIGFLGGGQLARMMALEARRLGYRIAVLDPDPDGPAAQVADHCIVGEFDDQPAAEKLAALCAVVTLDTEHIPAELLDALEQRTPVRPRAAVLRTVQDRREQRRFLDDLGVPQTRHAEVSDLNELQNAVAAVGLPAVLKTRRSGYDGKGQAKILTSEDMESAWNAIGRQPAMLEAFVDFEKEVSVLLARDVDGNIRFHPVAENEHRNHILHATVVPARLDARIVEEAEAIGSKIANGLDHVGMMAVELFVTRKGQLLVNEIAPRTHNSGHYTFGACETSQFEQHVRAICDLPLGKTTQFRPAIMINLLGDHWENGEPDWNALLALPNTHLHLYGKSDARPGRKMGHVLLLADTAEKVAESAVAVEEFLVQARLRAA